MEDDYTFLVHKEYFLVVERGSDQYGIVRLDEAGQESGYDSIGTLFAEHSPCMWWVESS